MLQKIHDVAKGWIAYLIVFIISIPFAVFGINEYFSGADPRVAAEVDGVEIALNDYQTELRNQTQMYRQQFGGQLPSGLFDEKIKQDVLDLLIRRQLFQAEVIDAGYRVGDRELSERIQALPQFRDGQGFSAARYQQYLDYQRKSKSWFEESMRSDLGVQQYLLGVTESAFLSKSGHADFTALKHEAREFEYFIIKADRYRDEIKPTDEQIQAYYTQQKNRFMTPERVKLAYIELNQTALMQQVKVDEQLLREDYAHYAGQYTTPEQRRVSQILIKIPADAQAAAAAKLKADNVVSRLNDGEDFAALAKSMSEDSLSAEHGGDMGYLVKGDMDPLFEDVVFSLQKDVVSSPIRTPLGYQIAKVTEIKPARQKPFEEVRAQLEAEYKAREAEALFSDFTDRLADVSYTQQDSLEPAAEALGEGFGVRTTGWITRSGGAGIGSQGAVRAAAFSDEVLKDRTNSELLELADGRVVVLRVLEHEASTVRPLEEVRVSIVDALVAQGARERARAAGEETLAGIETPAQFEAGAESFKAPIERPGMVVRGEAKVPPAVNQEAFSMGRPQDGTRYAGVTLPGGDYALIALSAVKPGVANEAEQMTDARRIDSEYGRREFDAMVAAMKDAAEIKVFSENLE